MKWLCLIFLALFTPHCFADGFFTVGPEDRAQQLLSTLFGGNIGPLVLYGDAANPILSLMFQRLNNIVVTIGVIVLSYIGILSTINTAHEGEAMGKKWSSVWVPMKALFGMLLMVPTPTSGYSLIQVAVMWTVLQGIGAANSIWAVVIDQMASGMTISGNVTPNINKDGLKTLVVQVLDAAICQSFFNNYKPPTNTIKDNGPTVGISSPNTDTIQIGAALNPTMCGQFMVPKDDSGNPESDAARSYKNTALQSMYAALLPLGSQLGLIRAQNPSGDADSFVGALLRTNLKPALDGAMTAYTNQMVLLAGQMPPDTSISATINQMRKDGVAYVGAYYYKLAGETKSNPETFKVPMQSDTEFPPNGTQFSGSTLKDAPDDPAQPQYEALRSLLSTVNSQARQALNMENNAFAEMGAGQMDEFSGPLSTFNSLMNDFTSALTANEGDPLLSIAKYGSKMMMAAEVTLFLTMTVGIGLTFFAFCGAANPAPSVTTTIAMMMFMMVSAICLALWTLGASLAVFLPMIPYMMYTVTFLGWLVSVVEAMIAAPILALGLVTPGGEELGKAMHGLMILTNVCLKPMLMVFGFIMASRLLRVAITMINYGLAPALSSISNSGAKLSPLFGWAAVLILYSGFVMSVTNKCFSLIYLIPNKIMRWIGSQGDDFGEEGVIQQAKQSYEHGTGEVAKVAGGALKEAGSGVGKHKGDKDKAAADKALKAAPSADDVQTRERR